jgi:malic enzyme
MEARKASYSIALAVGQKAFDERLNRVTRSDNVRELVDEMLWYPKYLPFKFED